MPSSGRLALEPSGEVEVHAVFDNYATHKTHLFVAIDRVSKFVFVELHQRATSMTGAAFLRHASAAFPYRLHTILTDNGVAFTNCASTKYDTMVHPFNRICQAHDIKHKLTRPYHPWTNGQAERMNCTLKEATVKSFHHESLASLMAHLQTFIVAYNFAKHLKTLRWETPFQAICEAWTRDPSTFTINPHHLIPGPYTCFVLPSPPPPRGESARLLDDAAEGTTKTRVSFKLPPDQRAGRRQRLGSCPRKRHPRAAPAARR